MRDKKGALELSINTIVIIVLAMTLLGLGLGLVRQIVGGISDTTLEVQEQVREQITGQLRASGEKISFPRDITFTRGDAKTITLGAQNTGSSILFFKLKMEWDRDNSDFGPDVNPDDFFGLRWEKTCLQLSPADADVYGIRAEAPRTPGTFALRANVESYTEKTCQTASDPAIYTTKLAFITVG